MRRIGLFLVLAVILSISHGASAALQDAIAALSPGEKYRVIFVTTSTFGADNFNPGPSDISFYNNLVSADALAGSLTGALGASWKALGSTATVDAEQNLGLLNTDTSLVKIFTTLGDLVATSGFDFWHPTLNASSPAISNQDGEIGAFFVGTGTKSDGTAAFELHPTVTGLLLFCDQLGNDLGCSPTFDGAPSIRYGINTNDRPEIRVSFSTGIGEFSMYGISSELSKVAAVPLPPSFLLFGTTLTALGLFRKKDAWVDSKSCAH